MLRLIWFFLMMMWFVYIGKLINASDIHIAIKVLLLIGDAIIGYYTCMLCLHNAE